MEKNKNVAKIEAFLVALNNLAAIKAIDKSSLQLIAAKGSAASGKDAKYLSMFFLNFIYTFFFIFSLEFSIKIIHYDMNY